MNTSPEPSFICVTQDGYACLKIDDPNFDGLCTDGLETCIALIISGKKGIVLFHDKESISENTIKSAAQWSEMTSWRIALNPDFWQKIEMDKFMGKFKRALEQGKASPSSDLRLNPPFLTKAKGFVSVDKEGSFCCDRRDDISYRDPKNKYEREVINWLNFAFYGHEEEYKGDLQFDSKKWTSNSQFHVPMQDRSDFKGKLLEIFEQSNKFPQPEFSKLLMLIFLSPPIWISLLLEEDPRLLHDIDYILENKDCEVPSFFESFRQGVVDKIVFCQKGEPILYKKANELKTSELEIDNLSSNVKLLCKNNYTFNGVVPNAEKAFRNAAFQDRLDDVKIFASFLPDLEVKNASGKSALDFAREKGHTRIIEYLEKAIQMPK